MIFSDFFSDSFSAFFGLQKREKEAPSRRLRPLGCFFSFHVSGDRGAMYFAGFYFEQLTLGNLEGHFFYQWLFLVPLKGGRWHIVPQLAVYTTYIPLIYCLLGGYMLPTTL